MSELTRAPTSKLLDLIKTSKIQTESHLESSLESPSISKSKKNESVVKENITNSEPQLIEKQDKISITKDYYKLPNIVDDQIVSHLEMSEEIVYRHMIRLSWGWNRNWCRVGTHYFQRKSSLKSKKAIRDAINKLLKRGLIIYYTINGNIDRNQEGTVYIVPVPKDQRHSTLPDSTLGILGNSVLLNSTPDQNPHNKREETGVLLNSVLPNDPLGVIENSVLPNSTLPDSTLGILGNSVLLNSTPDQNPHNKREETGVLLNSVLPNDPIKYNNKDSLKDTLSVDNLISFFYDGLGHSKISREKRERAKKCIEELTADNFNLEEILFAIEWTLKNKTEKLYDFSIIKHTIGEALATIKKISTIDKQRIDEENKAKLEKEEFYRQEQEIKKFEAYKKTMNSNDRTKLRERALVEIKNMPNIKEDFISDMLIGIKENEILRKEFPEILNDVETAN